MQPETLQLKLEEFKQLCKQKGIPVTHQRIAIYESLLTTDSHPSAESLFKFLHEKLPQLSLGTVYKTLETLHQLGLINEVTSLHQTARYDANTEPHHHLVCKKCKRIIDLYDNAFQSIKPTETHGFQGIEIQVQVNGLCPSCQ